MPKVNVTLREGQSYTKKLKPQGKATVEYKFLKNKPQSIVVDAEALAVLRADGLLNVTIMEEDEAPPRAQPAAPARATGAPVRSAMAAPVRAPAPAPAVAKPAPAKVGNPLLGKGKAKPVPTPEPEPEPEAEADSDDTGASDDGTEE